jgi:ubiquinone/menaquinone biosynthesis C-methylase UbiE
VHDVGYFDRLAPVYDLFMPAADREDIEDGFAIADRPVQRVLDVGGGTGRVARALTQDAIVVDASAGMLAQARDDGLPVVRGDVGELPFPDEWVDAVAIADALHHFPDVDAALSECARVLRPGGVLVIREFDPGTVRGRLLVAGEHLMGLHSEFVRPERLSERVQATGLRTRVVDTGFGYTVAGAKPRPQ